MVKAMSSTAIPTDSAKDKEAQHDEVAANSKAHFSLAGSVKLAKYIEKQVKADVLSVQQRGSRIVYVTLILAAIAFGVGTFVLIDMSQKSAFHSEFESYARETAEIAENNADNTFGQLQALALAITSLTNSQNNEDFPCHTIPHFDLRAQEIADHTGVDMIAFVPFVPEEEKQEWQRCAVDNQYWVWQDYGHRGWNTTAIESIPNAIHSYPLSEDYKEDRRGFVDDGFMEEILTNLSYTPKGIAAPVAQFGPGPVNTSLVMTDMFSHPIFRKEMLTALEYDVPVISETEDLGFLLQHIYPEVDQHNQAMLRSFTLDHVKESFEDGSRTVGYLVAVLTWGTFFRNLLPENVDGIVVKVVSDCGKNITYIVNGGKEDWAEVGDWHDHKYDHMMQKYQFFWKNHPKGTSRHCHFDFHVYPSDDFARHYQSNAPALYAFTVVAICAFMGILFYCYDKFMQKRQTTIMSEEARTESVVTALFPSHVSAQLLADKKASGRTSIPNIMSMSARESDDSKPLADLFPSATIMFADIAGFTRWSSDREPYMVFTLLENLYQAFDILAKEEDVFKIETIGDCYVAVAGVPAICPEHAVVMANFARGCLKLFSVTVNGLKAELGPETARLGLRVGLHSGAVTAGVLRGERARLQLFGDAVNTTARVESSGTPGCIHMSEETANELKIHGKESWLIPRVDQVEAKGKGRLTTFWLRNDNAVENKESYRATQLTEVESGTASVSSAGLASLTSTIACKDESVSFCPHRNQDSSNDPGHEIPRTEETQGTDVEV